MMPWNTGCGPVLLLRLKVGPAAGTVYASCTCEWKREFLSMKQAKRAAAKHEEANNQ